MTTVSRSLAPLLHLAETYGVESAYEDGLGELREPSPEALIAVLRALGVQLDSPAEAPAALRERREAVSSRRLEPIGVAWDGVAKVDLGGFAGDGALDWAIVLEDGDVREGRVDAADPPCSLELGDPLPMGYHRLRVEGKSATHEALIISAPRRGYSPGTGRDWGIFAPLYAVRSARNWGIGDFTDLKALVDWLHSLGGTTVATLPLLATFSGGPTSISPYSPVSRLFWNESFIDVTAVSEMGAAPEVRGIIASPGFEAEMNKLRASSTVDYEGVAALKRRVLQPLSAAVGRMVSRASAFRTFREENSRVDDYARFRATCEKYQSGWRGWPTEREFDQANADYHAYVQWVASEQLESAGEGARKTGVQILLDMPLGVHGEGYDTWSDASAFADGVTAGAPPDPVFRGGQNWGFPPPHPERAREHGYSLLIDSLRNVMRYGSLLRIDHIVGLHRLFWIPDGMDSSEGLYVHYPAEELYAILNLESHRQQTILVGEDLGTIPSYVRPAMDEHGILRSYVLQYELASGEPPSLPDGGHVATFNTHDMEPFAAFWDGENGTAQREVLIRQLELDGALEPGERDFASVQRAAARWMGGSPAKTYMVNLEDLWGETARQNIPGTGESERPNWRLKNRYTVEEIREMPAVADLFREVATARSEGEKK